MATLGAIKRRINSVKSTQKITRSMYMVAAARLRRAQDNIIKARPYAYRLRETLSHVARLVDRQSHPLLLKREVKRIGFVIVTADRGLCGAFNSNIIRHTKKVLDEYKDYENSLICIGRKSRDHFKKHDFNVIGEYKDFFNDLSFDNAQSIINQITNLYLDEKLDKVVLIYNEFKSAVQQTLITEDLLPLEPPDVESGKTDIDYIYEPDPEAILNALIPLNLNIQMWRVLLESFAAEQGARMTAMDSATENAAEMIDKLTLIFNRTRQAAITKEISEIVGGAEALK